MTKEKSEPVIEFLNVSKNYKEIEALKEASFSISKGDIFGYIGPNGAGKSTTLKILVGLIRNHTGEVKINGFTHKENPNVNRLIGYLPQDVGFQEWRTVDHALVTFGLLSGMTREDLNNRIPEVLELVGLQDARKRKIKHLSGGMKQKLKLAQAILHNPPILVLDEPLSGLDPISRWQLKNTIKSLSQTDVSILFSSHILEDVEGIATDIGIINHGQIVKVGNPQELRDELTGGNVVNIVGINLAKKADIVRDLKFVQEVNTDPEDPNTLSIVLIPELNLDDCLLQLMDFFSSNEIVLSNFNYVRPTLEQVYLKYVMEGDSA